MPDIKKMWDQQESFMRLLQLKRNFPSFPVKILEKSGQKLLKDITHECQHELFEANQHLKNSKQHRATSVEEFDRAGYIEELVDAAHYLIEIAILSGITPEEFYEAYMAKGEINITRINEGY